ncbi:MAG: RES family NAD+ phosphorylase [Rhizobiaceae bacterium]
MSLPIWTPAALRSEARARSGVCWRLVEAQHRVSTMKLVDTLDEQALLEAELERTKPPVPPECRHLHYLLASPFRYGRYPGNSRFRREGYSPGVFYAAERVETAVAETAFYRLLFLAESPDTPWPANPLEFTAFSARFEVAFAVDLTAEPMVRDAPAWTHPTSFDACLALAGSARQAGIEAIRYRSVRDPGGGTNLALLSCHAFAVARPSQYATWRLSLTEHGVAALCDRPARGLQFTLDHFAADDRLSPIVNRAKG